MTTDEDDRESGGPEVPSVDWEPEVPSVDWEPDVPTDPQEDFGLGTPGADPDPETFRAFWGAVFAVDVGLFCVVIGPVFGYARGRPAVGALVFLLGLVAFYRAYATYRNYVDGDSTEPPDEEDGEEVVP